MVEMVFVHGVNTRKVAGDGSYDAGVADRDRRFAEVAFEGAGLSIANPYWGAFGAPAKFSCIPAIGADYVALSLGDEAGDHQLLDAAQQDFPAVVAALSAVALADARAIGDEAAKREAEQIWLGAARYAEQRSKPPWLAAIETDDEFLDRLMLEAKAQISVADLGLIDSVKAIAKKLKGGVSNLINTPIARIARDKVSPHVAVFIGDVFRYLKDGDAHDAIRDEVTGSIVAAAAKAQAGGHKLVLAGHSMGAVILYDILSDAEAVAAIEAKLGHALQVDLFLSIGSQVALFEELGVYAASADGAAGKPALPAPCALWWNVFDKIDVLSFLCAPVFDGVEDFAMDTIAGVIDAHGAYFDSMVFYARLNARLAAAGVLA